MLRDEQRVVRTWTPTLTHTQEVVDDPGGNKMLLVMDYMEGGPVLTREALERGRRIPEPLALQYFRDMCKARPDIPDLSHSHRMSDCVWKRRAS